MASNGSGSGGGSSGGSSKGASRSGGSSGGSSKGASRSGGSGSKSSGGSRSKSANKSGSSSKSASSGSDSSSNKSASSGSDSSSSSNNNRRDGKTNPVELARAAARQLAELTGRVPESVLGLQQDDDGWKVTVEIVELRRVPSSTDLLGAYVVTIDDDGELVGYERVRRYQRGQSGGEQ